MLAVSGSEAIWTLIGLILLGVVYLAIAVSKLRERLARMEGREQRRHGEVEDPTE